MAGTQVRKSSEAEYPLMHVLTVERLWQEALYGMEQASQF
jgi:hypothetical protein